MDRIRTGKNSSAALAYDPAMPACRPRVSRLWTALVAGALLAGAVSAARAQARPQGSSPGVTPGPAAPVPTAPAQTAPARPRTPRPNMQAMNEALGVTCAYCHVPAGSRPPTGRPDELDYRSEANPRKRIARMMLAMTADINASIPAAVLKSTEDSTVVTCATCHRGVPDPRPLAEVITRTVEQEGPEAGVLRYRELRSRYFGRDAYDFSERTLLMVAQKLVDRAPEAALALMRLNLEFHPASVDSYVMMAQAETRRFDDRAAIVHLEKALEINPDHGLAQGFLAQLRQFTKPRK